MYRKTPSHPTGITPLPAIYFKSFDDFFRGEEWFSNKVVMAKASDTDMDDVASQASCEVLAVIERPGTWDTTAQSAEVIQC